MTRLSVYSERLRRGAAAPLPALFVIGGLLTVALIGATFRTPQSGSMSEAVAAKAFADSPRPAVATLTIVPADVLGKDLSWSPLTGDGSN